VGQPKKKAAFKGVSWVKESGRWRADIQHDKRNVYMGTFGSEEEAARAYDRVAIHLRKKTGLNFPAADYEAEQLRRMDLQALLAQFRPDVERTSQYRGVCFNKGKGKWEASIQETGKRLSLGSFENEEQAARAYDWAAIKLNNENAVLNFPLPEYEGELKHLARISTEDLVKELRRQGTGITRGNNDFRGVQYNEKSGKWQAKIYGLLGRKKQTHLGTFDTGEEAAEAYDRAAIILRGRDAVANFKLDAYGELLAQVERASPEERRAMQERLAQGDSSGAATSPEKSSAKGRKKAGPKRKASKPRDLGATRAGGGVQKHKAKTKRVAGSQASKPKLESKPEPEEVEIRKLEWPAEADLLADTPAPPSPRPAARRGKRRLAPRVDTPAAKRPKAAPRAAQLQQAEALEDLRGDLREAELKIDGLAAKSAQQERLIAHLERFNALVMEENEELRRLLANGAVEA